MEFEDERFKYFPEVESATIYDSTPTAMGMASSTSQSGADLEAISDLDVIGGEDFIAHVLSREKIEADVPGGGNLMDGISRYVDEVYSESVGFDVKDDVKLKRCSDGDVSLGVQLHYETDAEFVEDVELPGLLTVTGKVQEQYRDEVEDYDPMSGY
ncbi:MAG: hypothetical protein ABEK10_01820 [Candidatus Nanosalina sp.]